MSMTKSELREQLAKDVDKFLAAGGKIKQCEPCKKSPKKRRKSE